VAGPECIFCQIVAGEAPASFVYQNQSVVAFMDVLPVNPGHMVIIPRRHAAFLEELDEETGREMMSAAMRLQAAVRRSGLRCEGVNLFLADGEAAFQEIFHVHLHVFPRFAGDTFRIEADWNRRPAREELDEQAATIAAALR
jgi:diadenosine tetraphosphate (Ap4A) HIT family hydrolase